MTTNNQNLKLLREPKPTTHYNTLFSSSALSYHHFPPRSAIAMGRFPTQQNLYLYFHSRLYLRLQ